MVNKRKMRFRNSRDVTELFRDLSKVPVVGEFEFAALADIRPRGQALAMLSNVSSSPTDVIKIFDQLADNIIRPRSINRESK